MLCFEDRMLSSVHFSIDFKVTRTKKHVIEFIKPLINKRGSRFDPCGTRDTAGDLNPPYVT